MDSQTQTHISILYKDKTIPAVVDCLTLKKPELKKKLWIILTHGTGGDLKAAQLTAISSFLVKEGFAVLRFTCKGLNIKYRVQVFKEVTIFILKTYAPKGIFTGESYHGCPTRRRKGRNGDMEGRMTTWKVLRRQGGVNSRSMGSRAAAMLSSDPEFLQNVSVSSKILGVICLSYPLHKPKTTTVLRDEPLKNLKKPVFFLSGTKDEMCNRDIFHGVLCAMKSPYIVHWLEGCDHSVKSVQNYEEDMYCKAFEEIANWCLSIGCKC